MIQAGEVEIEVHEKVRGWAVFGGCDGEDAFLHAFFVGKEDAEAECDRLFADEDFGDDWTVIPCFVHELVAPNHYDDDLALRVLERTYGGAWK